MHSLISVRISYLAIPMLSTNAHTDIKANQKTFQLFTVEITWFFKTSYENSTRHIFISLMNMERMGVLKFIKFKIMAQG